MPFSWYVIETYPNAERAAERRLNRQLFATHLPRRLDRVPRRGRIVERQFPLFPGYGFVLLDLAELTERWKAVAYTRGVLRILPISERPRPIASDFVVGLHEAELDGQLVSGMVTPGTRVRVYRGLLVNRVLECVAAGADTVRVLMEAMGAVREVTLPMSDVTLER